MEQGNIMICEEKAMATIILSDMSFCSTIRYWIDSVCGLTSFLWSITYQSNQSNNISPFLGIPWAFSCPGGSEFDHFIFLGTGHLITHTEVGNLIVSLKFMLSVPLIQHGLINQGGDKLWWIQSKRLQIHGGLVENQRHTQVRLYLKLLRTILSHLIKSYMY